MNKEKAKRWGGAFNFVEALECPAEKLVLFKEGRADPLKGFDLANNSIRAMALWFLKKIYLTASFRWVLQGVKPFRKAGVGE